MTTDELRAALEAMHWSQRELSVIIGCNDRLIRRWATGQAKIPEVIAEWLATLAATHFANPPPEDWKSR